MSVLNLAKSEEYQGYIQYALEQRKDGQQDVIITGKIDYRTAGEGRDTWNEKYLAPIKSDDHVNIISPFKSFRDLEVLIGAVASLRRLGIQHIEVFLPYMLGARGDRKFVEGGNSYLCDVVAPILNSLDLAKVYSIDIHNPDVAAAAIHNFVNIKQHSLMDWVINQPEFDESQIALISPDAGAYNKIFDVAAELKKNTTTYDGLVINAIKHRDTTTNEIGETALLYNGPIDRDLIIVDDLCDGGRTFIELAKVCRKQMRNDRKLYLVVTHGVFSYGTKCLTDVFDGVFCTNSYNTLGPVQGNSNKIETVKQFDVLGWFNNWNYIQDQEGRRQIAK